MDNEQLVCNDLKLDQLKWTVGAKLWTISSGNIVRMQKNTLCFYSRKRKHSGCQWRLEAVAGAVGLAVSRSRSTDSNSQKDTGNVASIRKTTVTHEYWPWSAHDSSVYWPGIEVMTTHCLRTIGPFKCQHFQRPRPCLQSWYRYTLCWVHPKEIRKLYWFARGIKNKLCVSIGHCIPHTIGNVLDSSFWGHIIQFETFLIPDITTQWLFPNPIRLLFYLSSRVWITSFLPKIFPYWGLPVSVNV